MCKYWLFKIHKFIFVQYLRIMRIKVERLDDGEISNEYMKKMCDKLSFVEMTDKRDI